MKICNIILALYWVILGVAAICGYDLPLTTQVCACSCSALGFVGWALNKD